jgi:DNA-binding LacI/PurR family transcriptional regulator
MSLVGVDDSDELLDARDQNIWTTVRLPLRDLGAESARLLMRRIKGEASSGTVITLPVSLVVRGSTCPPKTA